MSAALATGRGRHAAPRRHRWILLLTLSLAAAIVATLVATTGTYALWNKSASTTAGTVSSGTATLSVGSLSPMNVSVLGPGDSVTGTFTLANQGSVPLSLRVATTSTNMNYAASATKATVVGSFTVRVSIVATAASCKPGLGTSGALATYNTGSGLPTLAVGKSAIACVELDLSTTAPQSITGAVVDFGFTATGTQVVS